MMDCWDALSSDRPYRRKLPPRKVVEYLRKEAGRLFDPQVVEKFIPLIANKGNPLMNAAPLQGRRVHCHPIPPLQAQPVR